MKLIVIGGGAVVALYIINRRKESFFEEGNEDFRHGFTAGFFTPGPFTIMALAGILATR